MLRFLGEPVSGVKADLINRILLHEVATTRQLRYVIDLSKQKRMELVVERLTSVATCSDEIDRLKGAR